MNTRTTMRDEIVNLAVRLHEAGIPAEAVAEEMLLTGAGVLEQATSPHETASRLERLAENLRRGAGKPASAKH